MQTPQFTDGQFVDGTLLNGAVAMLMQNFEMIGSELHTPGLISPTSLVFTPSALTITISAPPPFAVLFATGLVVGANGTVSGAATTTYTVPCSSFVPTSGSGTVVYIVASYGEIGQQQIQVVGPPEGHPDYDPTFAPFQWYLEAEDTVVISATTTPPNNTTTFELAHLTLTVGKTSIVQGDIKTTWTYASAVLNPTGVTAGTYTGATIVVGADGRITAASGVAYGPLAGTNIWTQANQFNQPTTVVDPGLNTTGALVVSGASGASILLKGGGATTPNKWIRVVNGLFSILSNAYGTILTLTDAGALTIPGGLTSAGVNAGAGAIQTTGAVTGGTVAAGTTVTAGTTITAGTRLLATLGAYGSGNQNAATILSDFSQSLSEPGWVRFPNGFMVQWGNLPSPVPVDNAAHTYNFPEPFAAFCGAVLAFPGAFSPLAGAMMGAQATSASQFDVTIAAVNPAPGASLGTWFIAVGE